MTKISLTASLNKLCLSGDNTYFNAENILSTLTWVAGTDNTTKANAYSCE